MLSRSTCIFKVHKLDLSSLRSQWTAETSIRAWLCPETARKQRQCHRPHRLSGITGGTYKTETGGCGFNPAEKTLHPKLCSARFNIYSPSVLSIQGPFYILLEALPQASARH